MSDLTREDLKDLRDLITLRLEKGFSELNERLDTLNGRTRTNEKAIAVLEYQSEVADQDRQMAKWKHILWGTSGGALVMGLGKVFGKYFQ